MSPTPDGHAPARRASLTEITAALRPARRILVLSHIAPDGDAIGSLLGLGWVLRGLPLPTGHGGIPAIDAKTTRSVTLACADPVPAQFAFLPGASRITANPEPTSWDAIVALDASDPQRLGQVFRPREYGQAPVLNLDHHVTNLFYGNLNYVDPTAASTAQIVLALADTLETSLSREAATCLLTGLVTDTLCFRTSNVDRSVLEAALRLMDSGANLVEITQRALSYRPVGLMRLWGIAMAELQIDGHVIWTRITQAMRNRTGVSSNASIGLASQLLEAPEAGISAVFSETTGGQVEISFRSRPGYDVAQVALELGGGGHPQASGCTVPGRVAEVEARVLPLLKAISKTGDHPAR